MSSHKIVNFSENYKKRIIVKNSSTILDEYEINAKLQEPIIDNTIAKPIVGELKFPTEIKAFPYLIDDEKIRREFDQNFEVDRKDDILEFFEEYGEPVDSINGLNIYAAYDNEDGRQYAVFDKPTVKRSSKFIFYMHFKVSKTRNGLFDPSATGYYPSNVWRSKDSARLGNKFVLKMIDFAFDDLLGIDYLVSDFAQTSKFTQRFKEYLSYILNGYENEVYVGLSFNKKNPICVPIKNTRELDTAMKLISKGGKSIEYAYKSIFVLNYYSKLKDVVNHKAKLVDFDTAIEEDLFTKAKLDPKLEKALKNDEFID